ncbi:hypothetical protein [Janibacter corallicola]|uniref:hypothetical protein n=1 Tax=Janibacter corallicola TaxID=415212 RepID=UPI00082FADF3|nr:hypothetical protein [Janibacter corallicola]
MVVTLLADRVRVAGALEFGTGAPRSHRRSEALRTVAARAGHGMWGLTLAPITAHVIAQGLLGTQPEGGTGDSAWLGPDRFSRQRPREGSQQLDHADRHEMRRVQ